MRIDEWYKKEENSEAEDPWDDLERKGNSVLSDLALDYSRKKE